MPRHPRWAQALLSDADFDAITRAIGEAEAETSGWIRVHLDRRVPGRVSSAEAALHRARHVLTRLEMHRTRLRNAVLIYVAVEDHRLAIVGDEGIHRHVGDEYWARVRDEMVARFRAGDARDAIVHAVSDVGRVLREHFPRVPEPGGPSEAGPARQV